MNHSNAQKTGALKRSIFGKAVITIAVCSLISSVGITSAMAANPLKNPSDITHAENAAILSSMMDVGSLLSAHNFTLQSLFAQQDGNLTAKADPHNNQIPTPFNPDLGYSALAVNSGSQSVSQMFSNFRSNYSFNGNGAHGTSSTPSSDSILASTGGLKKSYINGMVTLVSGATTNNNDNRYNLAVLVSSDRIDPALTDSHGHQLSGPVLQAVEQKLSASNLQMQNNVYCGQLASKIANPTQSFDSNLDSSGLSSIAKDHALSVKLARDDWSKPESQNTSALQNQLPTNAKDGQKTTDLSSFGASIPFGKPFWGNYTNVLHQIAAAKSMSYASIYQLCMERAPAQYKTADNKTYVESPLQHMQDHVNQINNPQYNKTIQAQSVNANLQELIKIQAQTLQMLMQIHKDNESTNANLASLNLLNASSYGSTMSNMNSMNINREIQAIKDSEK